MLISEMEASALALPKGRGAFLAEWGKGIRMGYSMTQPLFGG
jgi:hypothetical protein